MATKAQRAQALADALTNRATPQAQVVQLVGTSATTEFPSGSMGSILVLALPTTCSLTGTLTSGGSRKA